MSHPILIAGQANVRYQEMLQEAETERRRRQTKRNMSGQKRSFKLSNVWTSSQALVKIFKPALQK